MLNLKRKGLRQCKGLELRELRARAQVGFMVLGLQRRPSLKRLGFVQEVYIQAIRSHTESQRNGAQQAKETRQRSGNVPEGAQYRT